MIGVNIVAVDVDTGRHLWTAAQCAEHCGVNKPTFAAYAARGTAPGVCARFDGRTPLWDAEEVRAWHASRPSRRG